MKLRNKVIILPTVIMLTIFIVGMLSIEFYLKDTLAKNLKERLQTLSSFSLVSLELLNLPDQGHHFTAIDQLADRIGKLNNVRISFVNNNGVVLGDSKLSLAQVINVENHADRPEIIEAREKYTSFSVRFSNTLEQNMAYFTSYNPESGYFSRVAMNSNTYHTTLANIRWRFSLIIFITIAIMIISGVIITKLVAKTIAKERDDQNQIIQDKTRDITLIQTLTTMLNGLNDFDDVDRIITNIMPKILPKYSGAVFLKQKHKHKLKELVSWGDNWSSDISVISSWRQKVTNEIDTVSQQDLHIVNNVIYAGLTVNGNDLGMMYLIAPDENVVIKDIQLLHNLTQQMNFAFANLNIKSQLRNQAIRDPLTDLYNRRFMFEAFEQALNRADRHKSSLAVLMIDIDDFKAFNDTFGHDAGDHVLVQVASILKTRLRLEDIACRYGGEEFCVLCPDIDLQEAYALAEKLRVLVSELSITYTDTTLDKITISIGISLYPNHGKTSHELLKNSDQALYIAKGKGRNVSVMANINEEQELNGA